MSTTMGTAPQGAMPAINIPTSQDYPRLVFTAPYFDTVPLAELIEPSVIEAVESALPGLVPPYVQDAANTAVAQLAVMLTGSTMSGPLFLNPTLPTQPAQAASMAYVDLMISTAGVPEVPPTPIGQTWARQTGQWVPVDATGGVFLPITGGTMQGAIDMSGNGITNLPAVPQMPNGAASATWVLNQIAAQSLYQGTWTPDTNTPDLTLPGTHQNGFTWIATTDTVGGVVVSQPIPGLQGLTIFNGDTIIYSALVGQFQAIHAGGLSLPEAQALFLPLTGGQMSGALLLNANATSTMQATTLQQVEALVTFPESPTDGQVYGRQGLSASWMPVLPLGGGILTGSLTLAANAVQPLNAVPLQQLNSTLGSYVPLIGNAIVTGPLTMSGAGANLTLNSNAAANLQAVPLQQLTSTLAAYAPIGSVPVASSTPPVMNGTAAAGTGTTWSRTDHVHPVDTSRAAASALANYLPLAGGVVTGALTVDGALTAAASISTPYASVTSHVDTGYIAGGYNGGGSLRMYGSTDQAQFQWVGGPNSQLAYVLNNTIAGYFCQGVNFARPEIAGGGGGPVDTSLNCYDNAGNLWGITVDAASDERVKDNVQPTDVDALAALLAVQVSQFDVDADVAAWIGATGATPEQMAERMRDAREPVHVPIGMVAQQVQRTVPGAVNVLVNPNPPPGSPLPADMHNLNNAGFTPYLVRAIQQLADKVAALEGAR